MFNTTRNHKRSNPRIFAKGQFLPTRLNSLTKEERRANEIEVLKAKAAATKNQINRGIYEAELQRLGAK